MAQSTGTYGIPNDNERASNIIIDHKVWDVDDDNVQDLFERRIND